MPSELVRQHPKRNIPPLKNVHPTYAHALSCTSIPGCQQRWELCNRTECECVCTCMSSNNKHRVLWGTVGKEHTLSDSHCVYMGMNVNTCLFQCVCLGNCVCVRGATLLERARVLKVTRQHSGTRSLLYCLYVQKQTSAVEPCHWLVDTSSNMFWNPKTHCQQREPDSISAIKWKEQARHSKQAKKLILLLKENSNH